MYKSIYYMFHLAVKYNKKKISLDIGSQTDNINNSQIKKKRCLILI